jgi:7-carboxy-7-deazaguanine synthase
MSDLNFFTGAAISFKLMNLIAGEEASSKPTEWGSSRRSGDCGPGLDSRRAACHPTSTTMLKINEIFHSIQGESTFVGCPTVFVRTTGCNLRCHYCDTKYSYYEGQSMSLADVLQKIESFYPNPTIGSRYVCVTGGEPLLQAEVHDLMFELCERGYTVSLETSGSRSCRKVDPRVKVILDVKTPLSGEVKAFDFTNLEVIPAHSEIKFVIGGEEDFAWSENFCRQHHLFGKYVVLYSPSYGEVDPKWLAEKILAENSPARLQLQQHKYIWSPYTRGV